MSEQYNTETTLLPGVRNVQVMLKQKEILVGKDKDLRIQSWFVQEENAAPYVVQVIGDDADLTAGGFYTVMLRERKQTRASDGKTFIELQVAAAQAG